MAVVSFGSPYLLLGLLTVPLAIAFAARSDRRRGRYAVAFTNLELLASLGASQLPRRRFMPLVIFLLALTAAWVAAARPRETVVTRAPHATVVLLVDVSGSMAFNDVAPTRLGAAERAMTTFLERIPRSYRVGLVAFNSSPEVLVEPTTNHALVRENVDLLGAESGTAIGDGLAAAVRLIGSPHRDVAVGRGRTPTAAIVLLSDGAQTQGRLTPLQAAGLAGRAGIRVDTVALGTDHGAPNPSGYGGPTPPSNTLLGGLLPPMPPDPQTLAAIAQRAGGQTYVARSASALDLTYARLGTSILRSRTTREISSWFAGVAALVLLASLGVSWLTRPRLP